MCPLPSPLKKNIAEQFALTHSEHTGHTGIDRVVSGQVAWHFAEQGRADCKGICRAELNGTHGTEHTGYGVCSWVYAWREREPHSHPRPHGGTAARQAAYQSVISAVSFILHSKAHSCKHPHTWPPLLRLSATPLPAYCRKRKLLFAYTESFLPHVLAHATRHPGGFRFFTASDGREPAFLRHSLMNE